MIIRFDDISIRSNLETVKDMTRIAQDAGADVWWSVSPLVHSSAEGERIFPRIFKAMSDHRNFFEPDMLGVPESPYGVTVASHGLFHVDHRLLTYGQQELSIVASCSLLDASIFVPPFNKWNQDTDRVCHANGLTLVRFESGWRSMEHHARKEFDAHNIDRWYLHHRRMTVEQFGAWFDRNDPST